MRKRGFTLIELLAVIVILGVLALIATPLILNVVEKAREQAFLDSAYGIRDAAEYRYTESMLSNLETKKKVYQYPDSTNALKVKGEHPDYGEVVVESNGTIALALWSAKVRKCAVKDYEESKVRFDEAILEKEDCAISGEREQKEEEVFDGWVRLTLYYPSNSTERKWRLGSEGEVRTDDSLNWEEYTGPITIPLNRVEDVWIKYRLNNETVVIPPSGRVLVNIETSPNGTLTKKVSVTIDYDKEATTKEYRVGNSDWIPYTGGFEVSENVMIEARAIKDDSVYDSSGNKVLTRSAVGRDYYYVGNIGVEESDLPAPTLERLDPLGSEVARVRVTYPEGASKKIYKLNYGVEESYTEEISISRYGTYIEAYYYDVSGKRSKSRGIRINEGSNWNPPEEVVVNPPREKNPETGESTTPIPVDPIYQVPAPSIVVTPTSITDKVKVSVAAPSTADKVYLKLGSGAYQLFSGEVTVTENMSVSAYYVTYSGERSDTGYGRVSNIKEGSLPYIRIDADPYPYATSMRAKSVAVTLVSSDAEKVEYSLNGIEYQPYTGPLTVTRNMRIYARATNRSGTKNTYLDITNIGILTPPEPKEKLSVSITVVPDSSISKTKVDKVSVKISYDSKATKKYYSYGKNGPLIEYTGEFEVTSNTTLYAYAVSSNGIGQTSKFIDNITSGIAEPEITITPKTQGASKVTVTINYDQGATIKRYRVNGGSLRDYTGSFEVSLNGTIYAYSENSKGESSSSSYQITNIVGKNQVIILDKGDYFILYLNYPEGSRGREYKFKEAGEWKAYKEDGILLVKAQYKDKVLDGDKVKIKIENENGEKIDFKGDFYILDVAISEIFENIYMRWDRVTPPAPQIIADTIEPAKEVKLTILYDSSLVLKQYKVVNSKGELVTDWTSYNGIIKITEKNTILYARGKDEAEVWTGESRYQVTNIDEEAPVIHLVADYDNPTRQLGIKVSVTDDVKVNQVKWGKGIKGASYFKNDGTVIPNDSIVTITENDYYTFYASDYAGNEQVYTVNINNIDLTPPKIEISVSPVSTVATSITVTIDYGDATSKQYKIGNSSTWLNYTNSFNVDSYTVINNNLGNSNKTLTIYAKGKDQAGNEVIETYKVLSLDIDVPKVPVINANAPYPILTSYGVDFNSSTTIVYDTRNDIKNYYSLDNGATWIEYTGEFKLTTGTIQAKSVKTSTGLEVTTTKTVGLPSDALGLAAYDGNLNTSTSSNNKYIKVDSSMEGKTVYIKSEAYNANNFVTIYIDFLDENKSVIDTVSKTSKSSVTFADICAIPIGTRYIMQRASVTGVVMYEITPATEPTFTAENNYMLLHADPIKAIKSPYQMVTIDYFPTSVQRLYRIGTTGDWEIYQEQPIKVNQGETIYAKGIDQYGNETRNTSSYTANVTDAIGSAAYDGNLNTSTSSNNKYIKVDSSMEGKTVYIKSEAYNANNFVTIYIDFLDENKSVIDTVSKTSKSSVTFADICAIPIGTRYIMQRSSVTGVIMYEITPQS